MAPVTRVRAASPPSRGSALDLPARIPLGQVEIERRSDADLALEAYGATHSLDQCLANAEAKAGSTRPPRVGSISLGEFAEDTGTEPYIPLKSCN